MSIERALRADREREDRATDPTYAKRHSEMAIMDALVALLEINRHRDRHAVAIVFWEGDHPGAESAMRAFAKKHPKLVELREDEKNDAIYLNRRDNFNQFAAWYRSKGPR